MKTKRNMPLKHFQNKVPSRNKMVNNPWSTKSKLIENWIIKISWNFMEFMSLKTLFTYKCNFFKEVNYTIKSRPNTNSLPFKSKTLWKDCFKDFSTCMKKESCTEILNQKILFWDKKTITIALLLILVLLLIANKKSICSSDAEHQVM